MAKRNLFGSSYLRDHSTLTAPKPGTKSKQKQTLDTGILSPTDYEVQDDTGYEGDDKSVSKGN